MKQPDKEDEKYWSEPIKGDGKWSSFFFHEIYQNDLHKYIDYLLSKQIVDMVKCPMCGETFNVDENRKHSSTLKSML